MTRTLRDARGFSLIEMAVVILILGLLAAFSFPAYLRFNRTMQLKGSVQNLAGQIQLARQKAIATGTSQLLHFTPGVGWDYHTHTPGQPITGWKLPRNVTFLWSTGTLSLQTLWMKADGRADRSGMVILQTPEGLRDTVNVQLSGLVLVE